MESEENSFQLFTQEFKKDSLFTRTGLDQIDVENDIKKDHLESDKFLRIQHISYISEKMKNVRFYMNDELFETWSPFYQFLPLLVTGNKTDIDIEDYKQKSIEFLKNHKNSVCGWSGYLVEDPSFIPLYGLTIFLGLLGTEEAYELVDRKAFYDYIMKCKNPDGSFSAYPGAETDLRSTFAALFIAWMFNIITPELSDKLVEFTVSCQNYDGGFGPLPNCEAHGGYTYSAIGILTILNRMDAVNLNKCARWIADRQMPFSGGFNGRTHKLVDTCYTWWIGSPARTIANYLKIGPFWNDKAMSEYILKCAQSQYGGFRDRPPHKVDPFHTMWGCAGLCVCCNHDSDDLKDIPEVNSISAIPLELFEKMKSYFEERPFSP